VRAVDELLQRHGTHLDATSPRDSRGLSDAEAAARLAVRASV
jgi:hypothetical protein